MSIDWTALRDEVHALARSQGWYDRERSAVEARVLIITEVAEAVEAYREAGLDGWYEGDKPCGVASELADVIIRALDWAGRRRAPAEPVPSCAGEDMWEGMACLVEAALRCAMDEVIGQALHVGRLLSLDVEGAVLEKHAYNRTRPHRHGGKLA